MRKALAVSAALTASLISTVVIAAPADAAAARTLRSGVYVTPLGREAGVLPSGADPVPTARPGVYRTTRGKGQACALSAFDAYGVLVEGATLVKARRLTIRVPRTTAIITVSGPCKWRRL